MVNFDNLRDVFTYHSPDASQTLGMAVIRNAGMELAREILINVPQGPDQQAAIRKVREAVMTANAGVVLA